jgi:hypothetical protein
VAIVGWSHFDHNWEVYEIYVSWLPSANVYEVQAGRC